jgi:hypothetical protein
MLWFRKKHEDKGEERKEHTSMRHGKAMLENVRSGLNSQWFQSPRHNLLKELEMTEQTKGVVDDRTKERAITSTLNSLEGAIEAFSADNDQDILKEAASLALLAYVKIGKPPLLDMYMDVCAKAGMSQEEINEKLISVASNISHIDIAVNLYSKAGDKGKLILIGNKALNIYLESKEMDTKSRSRLFDYVVEAYKVAGDKESLIQAGEKALKSQIESQHFSHDKDWVLDAQKAYEAAEDKSDLAKLGDHYVNLYLKEGLEVWLDKAVTVYKESEIDYASRLNKLADRVAEKGNSEIADIIRQKARS